MTPDELRGLLQAAKQDALAGINATALVTDRQKALDYYMGDMSEDMPQPEGRSGVVSTDVADTVEGLMPSLMEIFASGDDVVEFQPVGQEDEEAAAQETDYVNHVFMQKNPGFLVLYSFIKDALLSKVGVVKVWWETDEIEERETYRGLSDDAYAELVTDDSVEIVEHSEYPDYGQQIGASAGGGLGGGAPGVLPPTQQPAQDPTGGLGGGIQDIDPVTGQPLPAMAGAAMAAGGVGDVPLPPVYAPAAPAVLHDVTVLTRKEYGCAKVMGVPPEEFGIERNARSLRDCNYAFHQVWRTEAELIGLGYDEADVKDLPSDTSVKGEEQLSRDTIEERTNSGDSANKAARRIRITEHYIRMNYEGEGKAKLYRVTTAGDEAVILKHPDEDDEAVEIDVMPFAAMTPVIITHRFWGRSIADLVMDIQRMKTAMLRAWFDAQYLANNPRIEIAANHAGPNTLDDLLTSRPGGIIRTKSPGGLNVIKTPTIGAEIMPLVEYLDAAREWRTGVTRQGQGVGSDALKNQTAEAVMRFDNAAQARTKLIARIFAETGIRDLFSLLHATIRKHGRNQQDTVRLRNKWVKVDPREWKTRNDMTINVGLGHGGKPTQVAMMMQVLGLQEKAMAAGLTNLVGVKNIYNSVKKFVALIGEKSVEPYFTDPDTQPPPEPKEDPKLQVAQLKAQSDQEKMNLQTQLSQVQEQRKAEADRMQMILDDRLKQAEAQRKAQIEALQARADMAVQAAQARADAAADERKFEFEKQMKLLDVAIQLHTQANQPVEEGMAQPAPTPADTALASIAETHQALMQMMQGFGESSAMQGQALAQLLSQAGAQKKRAISVVRDPKTNRIMGAEEVVGE
jgi:hypothetical protein